MRRWITLVPKCSTVATVLCQKCSAKCDWTITRAVQRDGQDWSTSGQIPVAALLPRADFACSSSQRHSWESRAEPFASVNDFCREYERRIDDRRRRTPPSQLGMDRWRFRNLLEFSHVVLQTQPESTRETSSTHLPPWNLGDSSAACGRFRVRSLPTRLESSISCFLLRRRRV